MIVYIIKSLGNLLLGVTNQEKKVTLAACGNLLLLFFLMKLLVFPSKKREKVTLASKEKKLFFIKRDREREREREEKLFLRKLKILEHSNQCVFSQTKKKKKIDSCKNICLL